MYAVENIINKAFPSKNRAKNILLINEQQDNYIIRLSQTGHNFYLCDSLVGKQQWGTKKKPNNVFYKSNIHQHNLKTIDCIISFNRYELTEKAVSIARSWHIPLIVVDLVTLNTGIPAPITAKVNIDNKERMLQNCGDASVGNTKLVTQSYVSNVSRLATTIPLGYSKIQKGVGGKILLDPTVPKQYLDSLSINFENGSFTHDPQEASAYLHLWNHVNYAMIDCMASGIPVVTVNSIDFKTLIEQEACVLIDNLMMFNNTNFLSKFSKFKKLPSIIKNAQKIATKENDPMNFIFRWNNLIRHISSIDYIRD